MLPGVKIHTEFMMEIPWRMYATLSLVYEVSYYSYPVANYIKQRDMMIWLLKQLVNMSLAVHTIRANYPERNYKYVLV